MAIIAAAILVFVNQPPPAAGEFTSVAQQDWPQEDGKSLGPKDAAVVIQEYADFQCPYCRQFHERIQNQILADYVKTGKARYEYHHFIVIDGNVGGTESRHAAEASECAAEQNSFWDYNNILFSNQQGEGSGGFNDTRLEAFAGSLGLDIDQFNSCFGSNRAANKVTADETTARSLQLGGTPSLLVNDQKIVNPMDYTQIKAAIDAALASAGQ